MPTKEVRARYLRDGKCSACGKPPVEGRKRCAKCLASGLRRNKAWQAAALADGRCGNCAKNPLFTKCLCRSCADAMNERNKSKRQKVFVFPLDALPDWS